MSTSVGSDPPAAARVVVPAVPTTAAATDAADDEIVAGRAVTALRLYPLLWAAGLGALFWPLLALLSCRRPFRARFDGTSIAALAVVLCLLVSVGVGVTAGYGTLDRLIGFGANLSVWVSMCLLLIRLRGASEVRKTQFVNALLMVGVAHSAIGLAALLLHPIRFPIPLLGPIASSLPAGIRTFTSNKLVFQSWLDGTVFRTLGMMGQPTWSGPVSALTALFLLSRLRTASPVHRGVVLAAIALCVANTYCAYSRSTEIAAGIALTYAVCRAFARRSQISSAIAHSVVAVGVLAAALNVSAVWEYAVELNSARQGSSETRSAIYAETVSRIADLGVPLVGYGLKPAEEGLVANVATHSTYLGLLFRAGILGLVAFLGLLAAVFHRCRNSNSSMPGAVILFIAAWCIFEDVDPGHFVPLFLVAACVQAGRRAAVLPSAADVHAVDRTT